MICFQPFNMIAQFCFIFNQRKRFLHCHIAHNLKQINYIFMKKTSCMNSLLYFSPDGKINLFQRRVFNNRWITGLKTLVFPPNRPCFRKLQWKSRWKRWISRFIFHKRSVIPFSKGIILYRISLSDRFFLLCLRIFCGIMLLKCEHEGEDDQWSDLL